MLLHPAGQLRPQPAQLNVALEIAAQPAVDLIRRDQCGEMVAPHLGRLRRGGEVAEANGGAFAVRRAQEQPVRQQRRREQHHLRVLARGNKGAIRLGDHKVAVEGQTAAADLGVRKLQTAQ